MVGKPTVISTFAGCGGSSLGYHLAGFREVLAVEWDDHAVETFRANFPGVPVYHGDIGKLSVDDALKIAKLQPGELDVFDGSPPWQGFSTAGARRYSDPRNSLFKEFARLLKGLQPKAFVMENVTGMVKGVMRQAYLACIAELRACGYKCRGEVMNAMYFGVPQSRQRVIIIGVRNDLAVDPSHPKPAQKPISLRQALGIESPCAVRQPWRLTGMTEDRWYDGDEPAPTLMKSQAPIIRFEGLRRGFVRLNEGIKNPQFQNKFRSLNKPSVTLEKTRPPIICLDGKERDLTLEECVKLASFPDTFKWPGSPKKAYARIGNSVPPNLMRAIAEHIRREILERLVDASNAK